MKNKKSNKKARVYNCLVCGIPFLSSEKLFSHMFEQKHLLLNVCYLCSRYTKRYYTFLTEHQQQVHICENCLKKVEALKQLKKDLNNKQLK